MDPQQVRKLELEVIGRLIDDAITTDFFVSVHNGEEMVVNKSQDKTAIIAAMFSVDEEYLYFYKRGRDRMTGLVFLVHGNSGYDVITDYSCGIENLLSGANEVADRLADEECN